jgi:Gas vesicle synthesis protein GvpO
MLSARDAAERAVDHVTTMTGRAAECVIGVERAHDGTRPAGEGGAGGKDTGGKDSGGKGGGGDDGGWRVIVEVVETRRIPDSADILATYLAEIGGDGELVSYRRLRRYLRGRTGTD